MCRPAGGTYLSAGLARRQSTRLLTEGVWVRLPRPVLPLPRPGGRGSSISPGEALLVERPAEDGEAVGSTPTAGTGLRL